MPLHHPSSCLVTEKTFGNMGNDKLWMQSGEHINQKGWTQMEMKYPQELLLALPGVLNLHPTHCTAPAQQFQKSTVYWIQYFSLNISYPKIISDIAT